MEKDTLFEHQKEGIQFLKTKQKAILADQMGLGKTRQAIIAAGETGEQATIVVCPASLKINWKREIEMVYPEDDIAIIQSGGATEGYPEKASWIIINYDLLAKHLKELLEIPHDTVVLDEAHYIKNTTSKRSKSALQLIQYGEAKNVYLLTGTPILNRPIELFNLLRALNHKLGEKYITYIRRYCGAYRRPNPYTGRSFWDVSGATNLEELKNNISDIYLRREKKEVLNLPEKIISNIPVELTKDQQKEYDTAFDNYINFLMENPPEDKNIHNILMAKHLVELQKIKQVCSVSKIKQITEHAINVAEGDEQVVIFTQYKKTLEGIRDALKTAKIKAVTISGEDNSNERQEAVDAFQGKKCPVLIGNIKAAGVGLTLTAATTVIFADLEWTPAIHEQAEDRCHRIGQEQMLNVYYYIAKNTIEEDILETLGRKSQIIRHILEGRKIKDVNVAREVIWRTMQKSLSTG